MKAFLKINESTIAIQCGFHKKFAEIFNKIEGRLYDGNQRTYSFPIACKEELITALLDLNVSIEEVSSFAPIEIQPQVAIYVEDEICFKIFTPYSSEVSVI